MLPLYQTYNRGLVVWYSQQYPWGHGGIIIGWWEELETKWHPRLWVHRTCKMSMAELLYMPHMPLICTYYAYYSCKGIYECLIVFWRIIYVYTRWHAVSFVHRLADWLFAVCHLTGSNQPVWEFMFTDLASRKYPIHDVIFDNCFVHFMFWPYASHLDVS